MYQEELHYTTDIIGKLITDSHSVSPIVPLVVLVARCVQEELKLYRLLPRTAPHVDQVRLHQTWAN